VKDRLVVLIPSYNEARSIGAIVKALGKLDFTVYVVDDGSIDDTANIARSEGAVVLVHDKNKGKGASLIEGSGHILKKDFDRVLVMDGDGQHRVEDIGALTKCMQETGADIVIGNRMQDTASMPYIRVCTNRFMSFLISRITGQDIKDTQCGFRLIKKEVLQQVKLESFHYDMESELLIKAARQGFKIKSAPVKTVYEGEVSRINPVVDTFRFFVLMLKILFRP
jgi:glycosyltransferase involved in cell wall biosynthesis